MARIALLGSPGGGRCCQMVPDGAEWFLMWQSQVWNGQTAATRMFTCVGLVLLIVKTQDVDPEKPSDCDGRTR